MNWDSWIVVAVGGGSAWEYLRAVWPANADVPVEEAIRELQERMRESPFASEILGMQKRPE